MHATSLPFTHTAPTPTATVAAAAAAAVTVTAALALATPLVVIVVVVVTIIAAPSRTPSATPPGVGTTIGSGWCVGCGSSSEMSARQAVRH